MTGKFDPRRKYRVKIDVHFNYSHMEDGNKSLVSFPFCDLGHRCPRNLSFSLVSDTKTIVTSDHAICMFRSVPNHLRSGKDGHLIVFFDADHDMTLEVMGAKQVIVSDFSAPIPDHHLCDMPYPIS